MLAARRGRACGAQGEQVASLMPDDSGELVEPDPDDMGEPDGDRDERVSLWPLSFEDVVRTLHRTPPVKNPRRSPKPKPEEDGQE